MCVTRSSRTQTPRLPRSNNNRCRRASSLSTSIDWRRGGLWRVSHRPVSGPSHDYAHRHYHYFSISCQLFCTVTPTAATASGPFAPPAVSGALVTPGHHAVLAQAWALRPAERGDRRASSPCRSQALLPEWQMRPRARPGSRRARRGPPEATALALSRLTAPMPCANLFGAPATGRATQILGASHAALRPSGEMRGPHPHRSTNPRPSSASPAPACRPRPDRHTATTPATSRAALSFTRSGNEKTRHRSDAPVQRCSCLNSRGRWLRYCSSGFLVLTRVCAGTDCVTNTLLAITAPRPMTVSPPRIDAPE